VTGTDHFSGVAKAYAAYRPRYPVELFDYVASLTTHHRRVWDCGAGSGQAAEGLLPHFSSVVATDISRSQLSSALAASKLLRLVASAERSPLASGSVDAVVVAQALHWVELPMFYAEVHRIVAHGGVIVVWSYDLAVLGDPELDAVLRQFYDEKLGRYWPPERRLVEARYRGISFPFEELTVPQFSMVADWTLDDLLGYVGTWSAVSRYKASQGDDPTPLLAGHLERRWGRQEARRIRWPLAVRAGRV
jgi:SAM-dependent methyltransferase